MEGIPTMTDRQFLICRLETAINVITANIEIVSQTISGDPVTKEAIIDRLKQERAKAQEKLDTLI